MTAAARRALGSMDAVNAEYAAAVRVLRIKRKALVKYEAALQKLAAKEAKRLTKLQEKATDQWASFYAAVESIGGWWENAPDNADEPAGESHSAEFDGETLFDAADPEDRTKLPPVWDIELARKVAAAGEKFRRHQSAANRRKGRVKSRAKVGLGRKRKAEVA